MVSVLPASLPCSPDRRRAQNGDRTRSWRLNTCLTLDGKSTNKKVSRGQRCNLLSRKKKGLSFVECSLCDRCFFQEFCCGSHDPILYGQWQELRQEGCVEAGLEKSPMPAQRLGLCLAGGGWGGVLGQSCVLEAHAGAAARRDAAPGHLRAAAADLCVYTKCLISAVS